MALLGQPRDLLGTSPAVPLTPAQREAHAARVREHERLNPSNIFPQQTTIPIPTASTTEPQNRSTRRRERREALRQRHQIKLEHGSASTPARVQHPLQPPPPPPQPDTRIFRYKEYENIVLCIHPDAESSQKAQKNQELSDQRQARMLPSTSHSGPEVPLFKPYATFVIEGPYVRYRWQKCKQHPNNTPEGLERIVDIGVNRAATVIMIWKDGAGIYKGAEAVERIKGDYFTYQSHDACEKVKPARTCDETHTVKAGSRPTAEASCEYMRASKARERIRVRERRTAKDLTVPTIKGVGVMPELVRDPGFGSSTVKQVKSEAEEKKRLHRQLGIGSKRPRDEEENENDSDGGWHPEKKLRGHGDQRDGNVSGSGDEVDELTKEEIEAHRAEQERKREANAIDLTQVASGSDSDSDDDLNEDSDTVDRLFW